MNVGANLEFAKTEQLTTEQAICQAAEGGYRFVEPYLYTPVTMPINSHLTIATQTPYHHYHTETVDTDAINQVLAQTKTTFSAIDTHATLLLPQIGVPYIKAAIDLASATNCPIVMSDEGPLPDWMPLDDAFDIMCISLNEIIPYAQQRGVLYAMELHNALTAQPDRLIQLLDRYDASQLGVNFDTGNSFLANNDPVAYLKQVASRVVHVHIKDIPASQLHLRGQVTGTRVGVAAGDGEIDLPGIVGALADVDYQGVLSIECDTWDQAARSRTYMEQLFEQAKA